MKYPKWCQDVAKALFVCLTEDKHGNCQHHMLTPDYHTNKESLFVTCPFHKETLRIGIQQPVDRCSTSHNSSTKSLAAARTIRLSAITGLFGEREQIWRVKMSHILWEMGKYYCMFVYNLIHAQIRVWTVFHRNRNNLEGNQTAMSKFLGIKNICLLSPPHFIFCFYSSIATLTLTPKSNTRLCEATRS